MSDVHMKVTIGDSGGLETSGYTGNVTAEFTGVSAAYNIGPMAIKFTDNSGKNINGITTGTTADDNNRELNLSMSF